jgi:hypothetical protein
MKKGPKWGLFNSLGRGDRIRTYDPLSQTRCATRLRYAPKTIILTQNDPGETMMQYIA